MKKGLTELVFILDRSGSMSGLEDDTIGGFNSMIERQRREEGEVYVSTVLFDDRCEVIHDRVPLDKIGRMTKDEYYVRGCTALLDAVGNAIRHISLVHRYAREEDRPEKTLFVITTDGMENASREYTYESLKRMVEEKQKEYGWEFLFLGANIDAISVAGRFGVGRSHAVTYEHDAVGTALNYETIGETIAMARNCSPSVMKECLEEGSWKAPIEADYAKRHGKPSGKDDAHSRRTRVLGRWNRRNAGTEDEDQ